MLTVRPHFISFKTPSGGGIDSQGFPIPVTEAWTELVPCRYETNTKTNIYQNEDGTTKVFEYAVWLDGPQEDYTGRSVRIYNGSRQVVKEGQVQHCPFRQLRTLLYVE